LNIRKIHENFEKYSKEYGGVFTVWLPKPYVVITNDELLKETFSKKETIYHNIENGGVIFPQGKNWREQRRTFLQILRDIGIGKNLMEEQVLLSAQEFLKHLASMENKEELSLKWPIQLYIANIINKLLYGFSYEHDNDDRLRAVVDGLTTFTEAIKGSKLALIAQLFPVIYRIPVLGYLSKGRFVDVLKRPRRTIKDDVDRALQSYSVDQEPECLVQAYYQKMQANPNLKYANLLNVCLDFFTAGMETTATTLRWGTLFLATHPDVQEKIRAEILSVVGRDGKPTSSMRTRMPYTNAAIQEIQRLATTISVNVTHRTIRDTSVGNVRIPADTLIIADIHPIMDHSPVSDHGHEFHPERFLMKDGVTRTKKADDQLCPFSIGKQQCAGETLARAGLFAGVVTLLQNYELIALIRRIATFYPITLAADNGTIKIKIKTVGHRRGEASERTIEESTVRVLQPGPPFHPQGDAP
ncbi:unspecific monooxygenase, partial [Teladorsagia circumcincta]